MSLYLTSLNSGSNGNCYYVANDHEAVLVDVGISCREVEKRMKRLNLSLSKVKAVFISHEHSDHIRGLQILVKKYQIPVYITTSTLLQGGLKLQNEFIRTFSAQQTIVVGGLHITAFPKHHDAVDPYSFMINYQGLRVGVFTDIGQTCEHLINHFSQCNAAFLESNYDEDMLENGSYPIYLKNRIRGGKGHLSNKQAFELYQKHRPEFMTHLFLSHLSKNNNCPKLVEQLFNSHTTSSRVIIASRYEETPVYQVNHPNNYQPKLKPLQPMKQLSISFS